jgi:hypothetical protein
MKISHIELHVKIGMVSKLGISREGYHIETHLLVATLEECCSCSCFGKVIMEIWLVDSGVSH